LGWLQARAAGGEFLLRIEDLDAQRTQPDAMDALFADLRYLGLAHDGEVLFQSQRTARYDEALARLEAQGRVYPCFCSRAEIARAASAPHGPTDDGPRYPGTCSALSETERAERAKQRPAALRFRAEPGDTAFEDRVVGPYAQDVAAQVGDFVVRRNDGVASYQLAVVVDDAATGITDVLRGEDLLSSTPRQLQLYRALGLPVPRFAHVPLVMGEDQKRLAKRDGAFAVSALRAEGVDPERVIGLLAQWSGLSDGAPTSAQALVSGFSLERVARAAPVATEAQVRAHLGLGPGPLGF
jgi:glutamyl-tRNA synthetase